MRQRGFTLIEGLLIVGAMTILTGVSVPLYRRYQVRNDLQVALNQATQGLERARRLAQASADSPWSFYVPEGKLFKGSAYPPAANVPSETYPMPSTIAVTGHPLLVTYSPIKGIPQDTGTITLKSIDEDEGKIVISVSIEQQVVANNPSESVTICHHPSSNPATWYTVIVASEAVAQATHYIHGDTQGPCQGGGGASSSAAASSVSSAAVSSSSSSAGTDSTWNGCSLFSVSSDKLITTNASTNVTFHHLKSKITFGVGGEGEPDIPVHVCYSKNAGQSYAPLFGGNGNCQGSGNAYGNAVPVHPGQVQETVNIPAGKQVLLQVTGRYKQQGWLAFLESFASYPVSANQGHVHFYYNGQTLSNYPVIPGRQSLRDFLSSQGLINGSQIFTMNACDILTVTALQSPLGSSPADYQSEVLLLRFQSP